MIVAEILLKNQVSQFVDTPVKEVKNEFDRLRLISFMKDLIDDNNNIKEDYLLDDDHYYVHGIEINFFDDDYDSPDCDGDFNTTKIEIVEEDFTQIKQYLKYCLDVMEECYPRYHSDDKILEIDNFFKKLGGEL